MAAAERITFADFQKRFKTEEACRTYLYRQRFPKGFVCPKCGGTEYYPIYRRNLCQCKQCRKQTSATAGTAMHRTHLSLVVWFWAIYLCANDKRGISASQLSKMLCIGYESRGICSSVFVPQWGKETQIIFFPVRWRSEMAAQGAEQSDTDSL